MAFYRAAIGGGGGTGFPYTKSGTLPDFTSINQEQSVDTGLASVKYIYVEGTPSNYPNMTSIAQFDIDRPVKQLICNINTANANINGISSANNATGVIPGNYAYIKVSAISGGVITIKGGNSNAYLYKNVKWYAG